MFGIGGFELFLILLFGFLIFGPDKLPAMAKTLGKAIAKFRSAQDEMNKVIKEERSSTPTRKTRSRTRSTRSRRWVTPQSRVRRT